MPTTLIVVGTLHVRPTDLSSFIAEIGRLSAVARKRDGNLSYDVAVLDATDGRLLVAERWRDEAALAAHLRAQDTIAVVSRWEGRLQGDVRVYDAADERRLEDVGR
jgi:quinol monooxygenase YgiN